MPNAFIVPCSIVVSARPGSEDISIRFKGNRLALLVLFRALVKAALKIRLCDDVDLWSIFNEVTDDDRPL